MLWGDKFAEGMKWICSQRKDFSGKHWFIDSGVPVEMKSVLKVTDMVFGLDDELRIYIHIGGLALMLLQVDNEKLINA